MKIIKINSKLNLKLQISDKVFTPTSTTNILIKSATKKIKKGSKILDLGCGSGAVGIALKKIKKISEPVYFSDLSAQAIKDVKFNSTFYKINTIAKKGSLFDPWKGHKFDFIINDVAAISQKIATLSNWYKGISCDSGLDGTKLVNKIISKSKNFLNENGSLFIPVISLSDEEKILNKAKKYFTTINLIDYLDWPLPKEMYKHKNILYDLKSRKKINFQIKWGLIICRTSVYMLK